MTRAVIFDMDGVLVNTEDAHWRSWKTVAGAHGVDLAYETFLSCFGRINPDCVRIIFGEGVSATESAALADAKERAYRDIVREHVPLAPGLLDLLADLRHAGFKTAVGSSAPRENIDLVLDSGMIRAWFDAAIDGTQVARGKPAPDVFLLAARQLGVHPGRCVVIEDAPSGIAAARAAGMWAVGVATTHDAAQLDAAGAHRIFPDVAALSCADLSDMLQ